MAIKGERKKSTYGLWDVLQWTMIVVMLFWIGTNLWEQQNMLDEGEQAPTLHLHSYDGKDWGLDKFVGEPVLVNFWGTWCPPCMRELPLFVEEQLKHKNIHFIGVAVSSPPKDVFKTIRQFQIPYVIARTDNKDLKVWKASSLPTTYLLDADHKLVWSTRGAVSKGELSEVFAEYIK